MKTFNKMLGMLAVLLLLSAPAYAQRLIVNTTLSADLSATDTNVSLTATTSVAAGQFAFVDSELMLVVSVDTTASTMRVQRGQGGSAARAHDNTERIFITAGGDYRTTDPDYGADCTRGTGQAGVLPWINTRNGNIWKCLPSGVWNGTNTMILTYNSIQTGAV